MSEAADLMAAIVEVQNRAIELANHSATKDRVIVEAIRRLYDLIARLEAAVEDK